MQPKGYSATQIGLHWIVAALVVAQFVLHDPIVAAWKAIANGETPEISPLVIGHVLGGSLVLALVVWRLVLRVKRGVPPLPEQEAPALKAVAHLTHWTLYALLIILPVSGLGAWFGGNETADFVHTSLKFPLFGLVVLHFAAALFQQFILRTGLLTRMLRSEH